MSLKSNEEKIMLYWLSELEEKNIISDIEYEGESFEITSPLNIKIDNKNIPLIGTRKYTPDFKFKVLKPELFLDLTSENNNKPIPLVISNNGYCYIDVKGENKGVFKNTGQARTSDFTFLDRQYLVYSRHNIFVNEVLPHTTNIKNDNNAIKLSNKSLFRRTFCPKAFINSEIYVRGVEKGKSKIKYTILTIDEYLKNYL